MRWERKKGSRKQFYKEVGGMNVKMTERKRGRIREFGTVRTDALHLKSIIT
jgi:hypothetical protein